MSFESCDCVARTGQKTSLGLNQYEVIKRIFEETDELRKSAISETHREQQNKLSESIIIKYNLHILLYTEIVFTFTLNFIVSCTIRS